MMYWVVVRKNMTMYESPQRVETVFDKFAGKLIVQILNQYAKQGHEYYLVEESKWEDPE